MLKKVIILVAVSFIIGCANQDFQKPAAQSEIVGYYSYTKTFLTSVSTHGLFLRADGTGYECITSKDGSRKQPIKHIGGNIWASSAFGTAEIIQNADGSITWGAATFFPDNIDNSNCK